MQTHNCRLPEQTCCNLRYHAQPIAGTMITLALLLMMPKCGHPWLRNGSMGQQAYVFQHIGKIEN
jgi:hypothetical protein